MGKRSNFERRERDLYPTPREAVEPLLDHIDIESLFIEPCAGDGALVNHLQSAGLRCTWASDVEPMASGIRAQDAMTLDFATLCADFIITNPPWDRIILHPMIERFARNRPTWLLFDADWIHTKQSAPFMPLLRKIVSVGRVKWIPDSKMTGKDNVCWMLFDAHSGGPTTFHGRAS